ncbi:MAG: protein kinase [Cyanobacteria bacterium]|nr:protein kinase [Cyanobacteriota bacterium]
MRVIATRLQFIRVLTVTKVDDTQQEMCSACFKPKNSRFQGSITQWVFRDDVCSCREASANQQHYEFLKCFRCGKRKGSNSGGSMTQWIFHSRLCDCAPEIARPGVVSESDNEHSREPEAEEEFEFSIEQFPVDRYKPLRLLGSGATGAVFKCFDRSINRIVTVKLLRYLSEAAQVGLQQEAKVTSKLVHPGVLTVLDFNRTAGGVPFMVTEFFQGVTLKDYLLEHGTIEPATAASIFSDVADVLHCAHANGIYHRDLKPANILLSQSNVRNIKVIDFGLARFKTYDQEITQDGKTLTIAGSPAYMSPEQFGLGDFSAQSEIYSLGCMIFEALTGTQAFSADSSLAYLFKHQNEEVPSLFAVLPDLYLGKEFELVISKCLAKEKEERYATAALLKADLAKILAVDSAENLETPTKPPNESSGAVSKHITRRFNVPVLVLMVVAGAFASVYAVTHIHGAKISPSQQSSPRRDPEKTGMIQQVIDQIPSIKPYFQELKPGLWMCRGEIVDEDLAFFVGKKVTGVGLLRKNITGACFKYLRKTGVKLLLLGQSAIDDDGLKEVAKIKTVNYVQLGNTEITDRGVEILSTMRSLQILDLSNTHITDRALDILARYGKLKKLTVTNCALSDNALKKFRAQMPDCQIVMSKRLKGFAPKFQQYEKELEEGI